uniref:Odorant receptor n=1 Tax=Ceracris kiangsu TaxID=227354 RepID=A0A6M6DLT7_CERKI|nr:odorant receptor 3 [Ceracris kiangsu]
MLANGISGLDLTDYLQPILRPLAATGMWSSSIYSNNVHKTVARTIGLSLLGLFLVELSAEVVGTPLALASNGDVDRLIHDLSVLGIHLDSFWKWLFMLTQRRRLTQLLQLLQRCFCLGVLASPPDRLALQNGYIRQQQSLAVPALLREELGRTRLRCLLVTVLWTGSCVLGACHWYFVPRLKGDSSLRFDAWYPFHSQQPPIKQLVYWLQYSCSISSLLMLCFFDCLLVWLQQLLCVQLRSLASNLRGLSRNDASLNCDQRRILAVCVSHHEHILRAMRELNAFVAPLLFLQCFKNMIVLCVVAFLASVAGVNDLLELSSLLLYFMAACQQLFFYCWCCEELTHLGLELCDAAYDSGWENWDVSSQKSIVIMMWRAQKPFFFRGGWFYTLNVATFVDLIRLSFSYYTVLRNMREG